MKKRNRNMRSVHIGSILEKLVADFGNPAARLDQIRRIWPDAVGTLTAKSAVPVAFKGKTLVVNVAGSIWLQELRYVKQDIVESINQGLGDSALEDIHFRIGPVENG
ncbi:MAG: DUF721 domain-containing protein [Desulfobacterales bacterium]